MFEFKSLWGKEICCDELFEIILDKEYTLREFVEAALSLKTEWGSFSLCEGEKICLHSRIRNKEKADAAMFPFQFDYAYGEMKSSIPEELMNRKVLCAQAHSGWSLTTYNILLDE